MNHKDKEKEGIILTKAEGETNFLLALPVLVLFLLLTCIKYQNFFIRKLRKAKSKIMN